MARLGIHRSLWVFGIFQGVANLSFMWLAHLGGGYSMMVTAIAVENLCSGMGTAAYQGFLMSLCDRRFTATQYALLSSLMAVTRVMINAPSGYLAEAVSWETYFLICTLAALPGLLLLLRFNSWSRPAVKLEPLAVAST